ETKVEWQSGRHDNYRERRSKRSKDTQRSGRAVVPITIGSGGENQSQRYTEEWQSGRPDNYRERRRERAQDAQRSGRAVEPVGIGNRWDNRRTGNEGLGI